MFWIQYGSSFVQVCTDLMHAAVPGLVAAAGLLEGDTGSWVLSVNEGLQEKLDAVTTVRSFPLLGFLPLSFRSASFVNV